MKRICILFLLVWTVAPLTAQTQRALVFGLGRQQDTNWREIHGDRDAALVVSMLRDNGFGDIRVLRNEKATKANMEAAFRGLIHRCTRGDIVYVHYSGHGQLMTDVDGDEAQRWTGRHARYDESWIPYDAYMTPCRQDSGQHHFCDDELATYLTQIRRQIGTEGQLLVVVDACHSGDATRGEATEYVRGVDIPFDLPLQTNTRPAHHLDEAWLTVSACRPYEVCFEHTQQRLGKLTHALYQLRDRFMQMGASELQQALQAYMDQHPSRLPQHPVVSGKK